MSKKNTVYKQFIAFVVMLLPAFSVSASAVSDWYVSIHDEELPVQGDVLSGDGENDVWKMEVVVACDSFKWRNNWYYESTHSNPYLYCEVVGASAAGGDSIVCLDLTLGNGASDTLAPVFGCGPLTIKSTLLTESQMFVDTVHGVVPGGCDSLHYIPVTIHDFSAHTARAVYGCESVSFRGNTYTSNTIVSDTVQVDGCDSITDYTLIISETVRIDSVVDACDSFYFEPTATLYRSSLASATATYCRTAGGCDTTITLHITLGRSSSRDTAASSCDSFLWDRTARWYYQAGVHYDTLSVRNAQNCDSLVALNLMLYRSALDTLDTAACDTLRYLGKTFVNDTTLTTSAHFTTVHGCDSAQFLTISIHPTSASMRMTSACDRFLWGGKVFTADTNGALATFENQWGCDSVVTLDLIVHYSEQTDTFADVCDSILWYGDMYYGGTPTHTFPRVTRYGCDSVLTLHLSVRYGTYSDTFAYACDSVFWRDTMLYATTHIRTPYMQYVNAYGCDSAVHFYATVHYTNTGDTISRNCDSVSWHGTTYYNNLVTPTYAYVNQHGCDSVVSLHIALRNSSQHRENAAACGFLIWHYQYLTETGVYHDTAYNAVGCDSLMTLNLTINPQGEGALSGLFEVETGRYVAFSQGNLQYHPADGRWRFAEHQYDIIGQGNKYASSTYANWIDLFGWGTSGYHNPTDPSNTAYLPYTTSNETVDEQNNSKGYGPSVNMSAADLTGISSNYDWGMRNAISNGGRAAGMWRTLTSDEWTHLLFYRPDAMHKRAQATIYGISGGEVVRGVVLLPESWYLPDNCTFNPGAEQGFTTNVYSNVQWQSMSNAGAAFFPAAGSRFERIASGQDEYGYYWSGSHYDQRDADLFVFNYSAMLVQPEPRHIGRSVRLAQDVDGVGLPCATYGDTVARADSLFVWYDEELTESGDYELLAHELNASGCDSLVVLHLTIAEPETLGVDDLLRTAVRIFPRGQEIHVTGTEGREVRVYDMQGRQVAVDGAGRESCVVAVPARGVYFVAVGDLPARRVSMVW